MFWLGEEWPAPRWVSVPSPSPGASYSKVLLLLFEGSGRGALWSLRSPAPELGERKFGEFLGAFLSAPLPQPGSSPFFGPRNLTQSFNDIDTCVHIRSQATLL